MSKRQDYGRPTKAAALGVLTELYTLAASPLYNGGNIGSGDNRLLVGYDDYDKNRWQNVVTAAKDLMNLGTHELMVDNTCLLYTSALIHIPMWIGRINCCVTLLLSSNII